MPRAKRPGLTGAALEKAVKLYPKEERDRMRKLLSPLPTASEIQRQNISAIKQKTTQPQRQAVLDQIKAGQKFGEIAAAHELTTFEVLTIHVMNQERHVYFTVRETSL